MDSFPSYSGLMRCCFKLCHCVGTEASINILNIEICRISKGNLQVECLDCDLNTGPPLYLFRILPNTGRKRWYLHHIDQ